MPDIIAGRKPVIEALRSDREIDRIVFLIGVQGKVIDDIRSAAQARGVQVVDAAKAEFRVLATDTMTQGVVAVIPERRRTVGVQEIIERSRISGEKPFLLILDEIEDPHNLGALIRTAEGAGVHGVIIPKHRSAPLTPAVVKTSAGATEHMAIAEVTNIVQTIDWLKSECGVWIVGLALEGDRDFTAADYTDAVAVVVGNEGKGIRRLVREHCDFLVRIPMRGKVGSLNASVSGGIVLYEAVRQRTARQG
jgi:23S rRNA (guanosine2251-2'-O)-methyltransferase